MKTLITLDQYKESEGISSTKDDVRTNALIDSVSQLVKTYCSTSFVDYFTTPAVELHSVKWYTDLIQLKECPVVSIVSVEEKPIGTDTFVILEPSDYYLDEATDSLYRTHSSGTTKGWPKGLGSIRVTYRSGYAECPSDLRLATIDLVTYYLKNEHKERRTLSGASVQNASSTSAVSNVSFPDHIRRVLDLYKVY